MIKSVGGRSSAVDVANPENEDSSAPTTPTIRRGASKLSDARAAARELHAQIAQDDTALVVFFASPTFDLESLESELEILFEGVEIIGCTTGGEISSEGYLDGSLAGLSLGKEHFNVRSVLIEDVSKFQISKAANFTESVIEGIRSLGDPPTGANTFAFLLIDGLCRQEESVTASLYAQLGDIQLFGGSAADGTRFERTRLFYRGRFRDDAAVLTLVQTNLPFVIFKTQHFEKVEGRMVVTKADAASRTVIEINGFPAAPEYARMIGIDSEDLSEDVFASHPVVVRLGGEIYTRSIMRVNDDLSLTFACAIDEGVVFSLAKGTDLIQNISEKFDEIREKIGKPEVVIGCDCLFRKLESEQKDLFDELAPILQENRVVGFATYGEQFNAMHINQTFTGVAIGRG